MAIVNPFAEMGREMTLSNVMMVIWTMEMVVVHHVKFNKVGIVQEEHQPSLVYALNNPLKLLFRLKEQ